MAKERTERGRERNSRHRKNNLWRYRDKKKIRQQLPVRSSVFTGAERTCKGMAGLHCTHKFGKSAE